MESFIAIIAYNILGVKSPHFREIMSAFPLPAVESPVLLTVETKKLGFPEFGGILWETFWFVSL